VSFNKSALYLFWLKFLNLKANFVNQSVNLVTPSFLFFFFPIHLHWIRTKVSFKVLSTSFVLLQPFSRFQGYQIFDEKEKSPKCSHFLLRVVTRLWNVRKRRKVRCFVTLDTVWRMMRVTRLTFSFWSTLRYLHYSAQHGEHWYWPSHVSRWRRARNKLNELHAYNKYRIQYGALATVGWASTWFTLMKLEWKHRLIEQCWLWVQKCGRIFN